MKTLLLTALALIKRVEDLQAFSVDKSCLEFGPADHTATLRPRLSYMPKVPTTPFWDQVVNLQALPLEETDPALALICPVPALRQYVDRTKSFRTSEQLFVLLRRTAEGKGCLQAEDGPLDSGCLWSTMCALPAQVACSLHLGFRIVLGAGLRCLASRHL